MARLLRVPTNPQFRWMVALLLLGFGSCAHPDLVATMPVPPANPFSPSGRVHVPDRWWTAFDDAALDREVDRSLAGSYTLAGAWQRVNAARALTRREASDLLPDVNGVALAEGLFQTDGPNQSAFVLGFDAAYPLDLWGQIGSRVEAQGLRASATLEDYQASALTLSAEVAGTWYALVESHAQLALVNRQLETNLTGLELQEARFALGQIRSADVLRQRQLVEATREQAVIVRSRIDLLEHALAVLQGRAPQRASYAPGTVLPRLPPLPAAGLPAELLQRRPDVRRDFLALQAADRDLASAVSAQYPRIDLTASVTTAAESPENLFRDWIATVAGQLIAPLFDGGERRAEVDRTAAVVQERFAQYGETILLAYREVEDALALERYQHDRITLLNLQLDLARQASGQLREQYLIGDTDYLDVLSAIREEQRLQRETLSARLDLILTRVALYLALSGGFAGGPHDGADGDVPEGIPLPEEIPVPEGIPAADDIPVPEDISELHR